MLVSLCGQPHARVFFPALQFVSGFAVFPGFDLFVVQHVAAVDFARGVQIAEGVGRIYFRSEPLDE